MALTKPKLDTILGSFRKTLKQLDELIKATDLKVVSNRTQIETLSAENEALNGEITKASRIRANIEKLIEEA